MSDPASTSLAEPQVIQDELSFDLEHVLSTASAPPATINSVVIGRLVSQSDLGQPLVDYAGNPRHEPVAADSIVCVDPADYGREAALMFTGGDPSRPILMGLVERGAAQAEVTSEAAGTSSLSTPGFSIQADDERVEIKADREIVLRCGKASITLTRAGKVLVRGAYLLSRSSGVNRIKGGSVHIN